MGLEIAGDFTILDTVLENQEPSKFRDSPSLGIFLKTLSYIILVAVNERLISSLGYSFSPIVNWVINPIILMILLSQERLPDKIINAEQDKSVDTSKLEELTELLRTGKPNRPRSDRNLQTTPCCTPLMILYSSGFDEIDRNIKIYKLHSREVIEKLTESFKVAQYLDSDYKKNAFWDSLIISLGKERNQLAIDQKSPDTSAFGILRAERLSTRLAFQYAEYGEVLQNKILLNLPKESEVFTLLDEEVEISIVKEESSLKQSTQIFETPLELLQDHQSINSCWTVSISLVSGDNSFKRQVMSYAVLPIDPNPIRPGDEFPVIFNEPPSDQLKNKIKECFFDCFSSIPMSVNELKERVAKFRYFFAQGSMYERGSALIGEWVEKAIYKSHGFNFEYKYPLLDCPERPLVDLDSFKSFGPTEFTAEYCKKAHVF